MTNDDHDNHRQFSSGLKFILVAATAMWANITTTLYGGLDLPLFWQIAISVALVSPVSPLFAMWVGAKKRAGCGFVGALLLGSGLSIADNALNTFTVRLVGPPAILGISVGISVALLLFFFIIAAVLRKEELTEDQKVGKVEIAGETAQGDTNGDFLTVFAEEVLRRWPTYPSGQDRVEPDDVRRVLRESLSATAEHRPFVVLVMGRK